ncbi:site-2 protease family protein [Candidatus Electronema sp. JC]|uniref:site-2 protease family protein n=1 Tax=Candidatus Electronema sp. JC TaxID=3401570 RepID=UPI003B42F827
MDIKQYLLNFLILGPPFLFALTLHELAHGYAALRLGDPTAKNEGRLTLNPLSHLDPFGTIAFFLISIGWAKPVPVNPAYFRNPSKGMLAVALAGPGANLLLALASALAVKLLLLLPPASPWLISLLVPAVNMAAASVWINIMLMVFNCLPIPPLDGSKVLMGLLPPDAALRYARMEPYGFLLVLLLSYTGVLGGIIGPATRFANGLLLG